MLSSAFCTAHLGNHTAFFHRRQNASCKCTLLSFQSAGSTRYFSVFNYTDRSRRRVIFPWFFIKNLFRLVEIQYWKYDSIPDFWNAARGLLLTFLNPFLVLFIFVFSAGAGWLMGYLNERIGNGSILPSWLIHSPMNITSSFMLLFNIL